MELAKQSGDGFVPTQKGIEFLFAAFDNPLNSNHIWLEPCWYTPYYSGQPPLSLLAESGL